MKAYCFSDIHGGTYLIHNNGEICGDKFDALFVSGDIVPLNIQRDNVTSAKWILNKFVPLCYKLPCEKVFVIGGNHDFVLGDVMGRMTPEGVSKWMNDGKGDKIVYLCNSSFLYDAPDGKTYNIYGFPMTPKLPNWSFYLNDEDFKRATDEIPEGIDILISHCPPDINDVGTVLDDTNWNFGRRFGAPELTEVIDRVKPKLVICGHIHSGDHNPVVYKDTTIINCSILDENYKPKYKPFKINL